MKQNCEELVLASGRKVKKYTLENESGMQMEVISIGATITKIMAPDEKGQLENVVLGWKDLNVYEEHPGNLGAIIGRVAGRIYKGQATIDGVKYQFPTSEGENTLHGGVNGFHKRDWEGSFVACDHGTALKMTYLSKDGEEGFPGNLQVAVIYSLGNDNAVTIEYEATTDKETIVNLTNHTYFNLSGNAKRDILDEELFIDSDAIYELDRELIPTGKMIPLDDLMAFDFRKTKKIGKDINQDEIQLKYGMGYDHVWKLNQGNEAINLYDSISKRCLTVTTSEPAAVVYSMNHADDPIELSNGMPQEIRYAICFETQKPAIGYNEINKDEIVLIPGKNYKQKTTFKFSVK